jgi:hypothetical protein
MSSHVLVVITNPTEGQEDEYNDWYDNVHLPDLLKVKGITGGQRFVAETPQEGCPGAYMTVYDLEADPKTVTTEITERVMSGEFKMTPAIDISRMAMWSFKAAGEHHRAD